MDGDAFVRQERSEGLRQVERGGLRDRVGRDHRQGREGSEGQLVHDGPLGTFQQRQERVRHPEHAEKVDLEVLFDEVQIAQIVVHGDPGVVDEDIEGVDHVDGLSDLRGTGHVQCYGRDAVMSHVQRAAACRKDPLRPPPKRLRDEGAPNAAVGAGNQGRFVRDVHAVIVSPSHG